jgi:uncharacterized membrane protein YGL010W
MNRRTAVSKISTARGINDFSHAVKEVWREPQEGMVTLFLSFVGGSSFGKVPGRVDEVVSLTVLATGFVAVVAVFVVSLTGPVRPEVAVLRDISPGPDLEGFIGS